MEKGGISTENLDIVYVSKPNNASEELRYSLRSLENIPHKKVWFYGSKPDWVTNVEYVPAEQTGTKWQNTSRMYEQIAKNDNITKKFILFNDDFFVLKLVDRLEYYYEGNLDDRAERTKNTRMFWGLSGHYSRYGLQLKETSEFLKAQGYENRNYELHIPIIFDRKKLGECLKMFPDGGWSARRSLYCNIYKVGGEEREDCKVQSKTAYRVPGVDEFVSTSDVSFQYGAIGRIIKSKFKEKSIYEI